MAAAALSLSTADLVRDTNDAARRAVLSGQEAVSTPTLVAAFERHRAIRNVSDKELEAEDLVKRPDYGRYRRPWVTV